MRLELGTDPVPNVSNAPIAFDAEGETLTHFLFESPSIRELSRFFVIAPDG